MILFIFICALSGNDCLIERINAPMAPTDPVACLNGSQPTIAQWMGEHYPNYRLVKARCVAADKQERDA